MWSFINLFSFFVLLKLHAKNQCPITLATALVFMAIGILQFLNAFPSGLISFYVGLFLYAIPVHVAVTLPYTKSRIIRALPSAYLMMLELFMMLFYGSATQFSYKAYSLYEPIALALYVACIGLSILFIKGNKKDGSNRTNRQGDDCSLRDLNS